jgi:hypothetical protein
MFRSAHGGRRASFEKPVQHVARAADRGAGGKQRLDDRTGGPVGKGADDCTNDEGHRQDGGSPEADQAA